jgi:integrase
MWHEPQYAALAQRVLAMPSKRYTRRPVTYLTSPEVDCLLNAPNLDTWDGRRDYTLLLVASQSGLRASELAGLCCEDIVLGAGAHVRCEGKGRKERCTPLRKDAVKALKNWLREHQGLDTNPLFPSARGTAFSLDGLAYRLAKHLATARKSCHSLRAKRVTLHTLRHTSAMMLLQAGVDRAVIALWLGHESVETTYMYLHADFQLKEKALSATNSSTVQPTRYQPDDEVLAFLQSL